MIISLIVSGQLLSSRRQYCCQKGLSLLTKVPRNKKKADASASIHDDKDSDIESDGEDDRHIDSPDPAYCAAVAADPIVRCRKLVTACRASGQRREDFAKTIVDGNQSAVSAALARC